LLSTLFAGSAAAQVAEQGDCGADLGHFVRPYAPATPPTPVSAAAPSDFRVALTLPLLGTSNAIGAAPTPRAFRTCQTERSIPICCCAGSTSCPARLHAKARIQTYARA
jgi:hypothetical protein